MENENKDIQTKEEKQQSEGWSTVNITPDMPLSMIIQFLNILNQRLCFIENNQKVQIGDGEIVTITELMKMQEKEALAKQKEQK